MDDHAQLETLLTALGASPVTLRREVVGRPAKPCGDWAIIGKSGHVYADGSGFLLYIMTGESKRRWHNVKKHLSFCRVTQDGDDEGCLHLDRLPTPTEARAIRAAIHLTKKRHLSPDALAQARARAERARACLKRP
jgi:hypothetical protein